MSRTFTDQDLLSWEVYASGGNFGLAIGPKVIFNCLTDGRRRPRYVPVRGDEADAASWVNRMSEEQLREHLAKSEELP